MKMKIKFGIMIFIFASLFSSCSMSIEGLMEDFNSNFTQEFIQKSEYDINSPDFKPHTMISQNQYFIEEKYGFSISAPSGAKEYCWSVQEKTISQNAPEKVISTQKDLNYTFSGNYSLGRTYILKLKVTTHNNKEFTDSAFIIIYSSNN